MSEKFPLQINNNCPRSQLVRRDRRKAVCSITMEIVLPLILVLAPSRAVRAQVTADGTVSTQVDVSGDTTEINGGTSRGGNLFHSFSEFSATTNDTVYFNNSSEIDNIIGRITGNSGSNIDGLLRANGDANLILINPNGINFGANARLQIGGSFLASTANKIIFEDGTSFATGDRSLSPNLTVSVPIGLQLGLNSAQIEVTGGGDNLSLTTPIFAPYSRGEVAGLQLDSGQTIGLVGSGINFTGGAIASETGRIELGSVAEGIVGIDLGNGRISLNYEEVTAFQDISLEQESLVDTTGDNGGSIHLQGNNISLSDGSAILNQNLGQETSGNITINAVSSLSVSGIDRNGIIATGIYTEALSSGKGGNISIATPRLDVLGGASIFTDSFSEAKSGRIVLDVTESLQIDGFAANNPNQFSLVGSQVYGSGDAGGVVVNTNTLSIFNGGNISSVTASPNATGSGGDVTVNATESILLSGVNPITLAPSQITAGSGSAGNAGNVAIETKNLTVIDGGRVDASATATGDAGNVAINASESIMVTGTVPDSRNPSLIVASANILDPELRQLFGLPDEPTANSGSIAINTPLLEVMNGGQVTVRNEGTGNAGNLAIAADNISLTGGGGITAAVEEGLGGKIDLQITNGINLTGGSQISSDNRGSGDGGQISVTASSLSISDRSFMTTTTFGAGKGGDITLNLLDSIDITGIGFEQFQETFQANSLDGSLEPGTRGTGIFIGTAANGQGGNLEIRTNSLNLTQGGIIFSPIFTAGTGGDIAIDALNIDISGSALQIGAGVDSNELARGGNIFIETDNLTVRDGGTIVNGTFGEATGGDIEIQAREAISLQNTPTGSRLFTGIYANTSIGTGAGGDIALETKNLAIDDAFISSSTGGFINDDATLAFSGGGNGGNIALTVAETIEIKGIPTDPRFASGINSNSFTDGAAGNIQLKAERLVVRDGSEIAATAIGSGAGGNIQIEVADSLELIGTTTVNNMQRGGIVATSGRSAFPQFTASGASGNIAIATGNLQIEAGASIDVQSLGTGSAGNLAIQTTGDIVLDNEGTISADNRVGNGGNISILADNIFWRGNSSTTATAQGNANGGNIEIVGTNLVVLEASQLSAQANMGRGGNIDINAKGLFVCQECIISASSQLGVDGLVEIDTLEPDTTFGIVEVPIELTQPEETVAQACSNSLQNNDSRLIVTGKGGLPNSPKEDLSSKSIVSFDIPQANISNSVKNQSSNKLPPPARNWYKNSQGEIILTAYPATSSPQFNAVDCHAP